MLIFTIIHRPFYLDVQNQRSIDGENSNQKNENQKHIDQKRKNDETKAIKLQTTNIFVKFCDFLIVKIVALIWSGFNSIVFISLHPIYLCLSVLWTKKNVKINN